MNNQGKLVEKPVPAELNAPTDIQADLEARIAGAAPASGDLAAGSLASEQSQFDRHLVPAHVLAELDAKIAGFEAEQHSVLIPDKVYESDKVWRQLKGDAGQGRAYADLVGRYGRERIEAQVWQQTPAGELHPDFVVKSDERPGQWQEVVDAKAWLLRPKGPDGEPLQGEALYRKLQERPAASELMNLAELKRVVNRYAASPDLAPNGKVVLYLPEDVHRYAPQVKTEIEAWSGTEVARGKAVEVRSLGVWEKELWADVAARKQNAPHLK